MLEDEQIMLQIKTGRVEMLAILFERYHVKLFNFFLRLTGERGASEDMVQDVFLRILKYRDSYKGECKYSAWMYRIARNVNIDHLKKRKKEVPLEDRWDEEPAPELHPEQVMTGEQERELLNKALAGLSGQKKEVLVLSRFQNMKYRDIAELLDCSVENVKVLAHRAIKELRRSFQGLKGGAI